MTVAVRDASTVLALRDGADGLEVFMVKRNSRLGFLGGAHVFPGGAVETDDSADEIARLTDGLDAAEAARVLGVGDPARARAHYVAAIRELFEEAGILLARDARTSEWLEHDPCGEGAELTDCRKRLASGELRLVDFVRERRLRLAADALCYFAHWITPEREPKRFNTRFFLAAMPARQHARHDRGESVEGEWLRPRDALSRYAAREIELVPPTICALDRLCLHDCVSDALHAAQELEVVEVLPKIAIDGANVTILYPGDEDYETGIAREAGRGRMLNRLVLRDGIWVRP